MNRFDSTSAERLQRENARAGRPLRRARGERDHFLRAVSHDMSANFMLLESSFSRLKQALGTAPRSELDETVAHVDACLDESKRLLDDLARLAKSGSVEMDSARVSLAGVVEEVLFEQGELLLERSVRVDVARPLPSLWCNRQRLKQVVTNLVRNAIKHGGDPERPIIEISVTAAQDSPRDPDGRPLVVLRVYDNGPGIDTEQKERVFLPGVRLADASEEGSGMGLAIVRKIATHYGGTAWVDLDCHDGTAMMVSLPSDPGLTPDLDQYQGRREHDGPHPGVSALLKHSRPSRPSRHDRG